jgi:hypothetical protein
MSCPAAYSVVLIDSNGTGARRKHENTLEWAHIHKSRFD